MALLVGGGVCILNKLLSPFYLSKVGGLLLYWNQNVRGKEEDNSTLKLL